jgi:very-short-patch-repair endonuclease
LTEPTPIGESVGAFLTTLAANVVHAARNHRDLEPRLLSPAEIDLAAALHRLDLHPEQQHPIGQYAADFYFPDVKLCVEVDGRSHYDRREHDAQRDRALKAKGIRTLRIPAGHVRRNADACARHVQIVVDELQIGQFDGGG